MRKAIIALGVASLVMLPLTVATCEPDTTRAPAASDSVEPEPGAPAQYAPLGWPLEVGDKITAEEHWELRHEFIEYRGLIAVHADANNVYSARFRDAGWDRSDRRFPGSGKRWIYEGHFPDMLAGPVSDVVLWETSHLPPLFHGKIEYREPSKLPSRYPSVPIEHLMVTGKDNR